MNSPDRRQTDQARDRSALSRETLGMIIIVAVILAIVIARSWHFMKWSVH